MLTWDVGEKVKSALKDQPGPSSCPTNRLFVPHHLRSNVLQWAHCSPLTCHPGIQRTKEVLQRRFWWATLHEDTMNFVGACPNCNQCKSPRQAPAGFLHPLPVPHRPWSPVSLDLVTGLPHPKDLPPFLQWWTASAKWHISFLCLNSHQSRRQQN